MNHETYNEEIGESRFNCSFSWYCSSRIDRLQQEGGFIG